MISHIVEALRNKIHHHQSAAEEHAYDAGFVAGLAAAVDIIEKAEIA